jgi:hypothetical protein
MLDAREAEPIDPCETYPENSRERAACSLERQLALGPKQARELVRIALAGASAPAAAWRFARSGDPRDASAFERLAPFDVVALVATAACELVGILVF